MMDVVYIAGAYRAKSINQVYNNIQLARNMAIKYWRMGYAVICPHMNTALMDGAADDSVWLAGDLELLRRSDVVVMLPGWAMSQGACDEQALASREGKKIIYEEG